MNCSEAEILLKDVEGKGVENDFFAYRQNRMNYWACLALKARYYLWIQDEGKAIDYASRVLSGEKFSLSQETDFVQKDYVSNIIENAFLQEILEGKYNAEEIQKHIEEAQNLTKEIETIYKNLQKQIEKGKSLTDMQNYIKSKMNNCYLCEEKETIT